MNDPDRFLKIQQLMYPRALAEIKSGRKRTHWMWYIFPQLRGLGRSANAIFYGISGEEEAKAYLSHPILGARLAEICEALLALECSDPYLVMGSPDELKLCSSMTLFEAVSSPDSVFSRVLEKFYGSARDTETLKLLNK